jgi:putative membrane protein insertion efficiency factor
VKYLLLLIIKIYQMTLSFDHGIAGKIFPHIKVCIYHPSCSEYGYQSIDKYGTFIGGYLTANRILRCGPWSEGGEDPVKQLNLNYWTHLLTKI